MDVIQIGGQLPLRHSPARRFNLRDCAAISGRNCPGGVLDSSSARRVYRTHAGAANRVSGHPVQLVTVARDGGFGIPGHVIQQGFARLLQIFIKESKRERLRKA
jgi:hypothetical protein